MDVKTSPQDMTVQLHLDSVTVQDKARPNDSPFRNMIYSTPDETSHGGLIHVTYWASAGGVRRVPPTSITDTKRKEYDMVVDARFSTLQVSERRRVCGIWPPAQVRYRHDHGITRSRRQ